MLEDVRDEHMDDEDREEPEPVPVIEPNGDPVVIIEPPPDPVEPGTELLDGTLESLRTVITVITGIDMPVEDYRAHMEELGFSTDDGISLQMLHDYLEMNELSCGLLADGTPDGICAFVANGFPVIISGDLGEILGTDYPYEDIIWGEDADHAFVIQSIDYDDPDNPIVTLYALDGSATGEEITVPLSELEDAWQDGGNDYLVIGFTEEEVLEETSAESRDRSARHA